MWMRALFPILIGEIFCTVVDTSQTFTQPKMERGSCGSTVLLMNSLLKAKAKANQTSINSSKSRMRLCHSPTLTMTPAMVCNELPRQRILREIYALIAAT